jgi:hypothetical protein
LIIPMIIQTIPLDPSGAVWTDAASNVSRPDPFGADQIDVEHQATDLAVGFESLAARPMPNWCAFATWTLLRRRPPRPEMIAPIRLMQVI